MTPATATPPASFWIVAVLLTLWEGIGCGFYLVDASSGRLDAGPVANAVLFALAVWIGLAGGILLLLRRRVAWLGFLGSLVAFVALIVGVLADFGRLENYVLSTATFVIGVFAVWYARHAGARGWLR